VAIVVSLTNFKGGVGKTTLCGLLGLELIKLGKKVLFIDTDPQANLTKTLAYGVPLPGGIKKILTEKKVEIDDLISPIPDLNAYIVPSTDILLAVKESYAFANKPYDYLQEMFLRSRRLSTFDYVLLDYAPSVSFMFVTGIFASTHIIVPLDPSEHSWVGIAGFKELMIHYNIKGKELRYLASSINRTVTDDMTMARRIAARDDAFKSIVPRLKVFPRAFFERKSLTDFAPERRAPGQRGFPTAAEEWEEFVSEFLEWTCYGKARQ